MEAHELDLLIFGDSWARDAALDTWPELLARRLRWRSANFAVPYSGSADLQRQLRRLHSRLEHSSEEVCSLDCVAIVHTGGNDLFHASPAALAAVVASGGCCGALLPEVVRTLASNVRDFLQGLLALGVRHIVLVGVPLTVSMPFIADPVAAVPGALCLSRAVMRGCNAVLIAGLRRALAEAQQRSSDMRVLTGVCLDEAAAIDAAVGAAPGDDWWEDVSHPSQALHEALAGTFERELRCAMRCDLPAPAKGGAARDGREETDDERTPMLAFAATPATPDPLL